MISGSAVLLLRFGRLGECSRLPLALFVSSRQGKIRRSCSTICGSGASAAASRDWELLVFHCSVTELRTGLLVQNQRAVGFAEVTSGVFSILLRCPVYTYTCGLLICCHFWYVLAPEFRRYHKMGKDEDLQAMACLLRICEVRDRCKFSEDEVLLTWIRNRKTCQALLIYTTRKYGKLSRPATRRRAHDQLATTTSPRQTSTWGIRLMQRKNCAILASAVKEIRSVVIYMLNKKLIQEQHFLYIYASEILARGRFWWTLKENTGM